MKFEFWLAGSSSHLTVASLTSAGVLPHREHAHRLLEPLLAKPEIPRFSAWAPVSRAAVLRLQRTVCRDLIPWTVYQTSVVIDSAEYAPEPDRVLLNRLLIRKLGQSASGDQSWEEAY